MIHKTVKLSKQILISYKNLFLRRMVKPLPIQQFQVEVTKKCNGSCIYCNQWQTTNHQNEITVADLKHGLQSQSLLSKVDSIGITGGEPFLRPDLFYIVQTLKELVPQASIGLVTNGLMPELVLQAMLELREIDKTVHIGVSIDGFEKEDTIHRGNPLHYTKAWQTITLLLEEKFPIAIGSVITPYNIDSAIEFENYCMKLGIPHSIMTANTSQHFYGNTRNPIMKRLAIPKEKHALFKQLCMNGKVTAFDYYFPKYLKKPRQIMPCFSGFNSFFLNANGFVYPCIHLNQPFGNIKKQTLGEIWNSYNATSVREGIVREDCHCWTMCETSGWFKANIIPAVKKQIIMKIMGVKT